MIKYIFISILAITLLFMFGFTQASKKLENHQSKISFNKNIKPVLATNCAQSNCHAGPDPWMDLNLSGRESYDNLVNSASKEVSRLKLILPFKPDSSYVVQKIKGLQSKGARMPYKKELLSIEEISLIEEWIKQGAVKN